MIGKYYRILDKGFIGLVDVMGSDACIEQAARTSYKKGTRKVSETETLLRMLMRHRHTTPFEMVELKWDIFLPMDAWRQAIRHRTFSVNESSTRYSEAFDETAATSPDKWRVQSKDNKQGSSGYLTEWPAGWEVRMTRDACEFEIRNEELGIFDLVRWNKIGPLTPGAYLSYLEKNDTEQVRHSYERGLALGVAREQARKNLTLSTYTRAFWKSNLHNLFHFLKLRTAPDAQLEIRAYADCMASIVKEVFPLSFKAWYDYAYGGVGYSLPERKLISSLLRTAGQYHITSQESYENFLKAYDIDVEKDYEKFGLTKREVKEFWSKFSSELPAKDFDIKKYTEIIPE